MLKGKDHKKTQKPIKFLESSDSDDSNVVEYQGSTYADFEASERTLRTDVPNTKIQGNRDDTTKEKSAAKRMKLENSPIEDFYMDDVGCDGIKSDPPTEDFYGEQDFVTKFSGKQGGGGRSITNNLAIHGLKVHKRI
jgi:hypothetical protein